MEESFYESLSELIKTKCVRMPLSKVYDFVKFAKSHTINVEGGLIDEKSQYLYIR